RRHCAAQDGGRSLLESAIRSNDPKPRPGRGREWSAEQMNWLNDVLENDPDPAETREWMESIKAVIDAEGPGRAHHLLENMVELTRRAGAHLPFAPTTEYINTIPPHLEPGMPGDAAMEWK